jgi:hypothetical protein
MGINISSITCKTGGKLETFDFFSLKIEKGGGKLEAGV